MKRNIKIILALWLSVLLVVSCMACQSEQEDIYDQFAGSEAPRWRAGGGERRPGGGDPRGRPLRGADHLGEVPHLGEQRPGDGGREFEEQHPGVTVTIQPGLTMEEAYSGGHRPVPGSGKELHRSPGGGAHQRGPGLT